MDDHRHAVALFRYSLIREAADPSLGPRERGMLVRALAERDHLGPKGERVRVSRNTIDRWIRAWRQGGFEALLPDPRVGVPRSPAKLLELAVTLKREAPRRTSAQIAQILAEQTGHSPHPRTLLRHFARIGLDRQLAGRPPRAFGRFEAERPNDLWTADALHGPTVAGRKSYLFAAIDDHSRALVGYRWGLGEDTVRLEAALRAGLSARGVPATLYVDNGSAFKSRQLERACAVLGIRLTHSAPGEPQGRGKIERVFGTVRSQFLVELDARGGAGDLAELNRVFAAWVEGPTTAAPTPRPARHPCNGSWPPARRRCPAPSGCGRRSCGRRKGRWPRRPRSGCTATPTRSTPPWSGPPWSWSSTRST